MGVVKDITGMFSCCTKRSVHFWRAEGKEAWKESKARVDKPGMGRSPGSSVGGVGRAERGYYEPSPVAIQTAISIYFPKLWEIL